MPTKQHPISLEGGIHISVAGQRLSEIPDRHKCGIPLVLEGRLQCAQQLFDMIVLVRTGPCHRTYCHPGRHANTVAPCLLPPCLILPDNIFRHLSPMNARIAPDTFNLLRHVVKAILSFRPKCSHRCVSLKETPLKPVHILKRTTKNSTEQTAMRTKWFKHMCAHWEHCKNQWFY